MENNPVVYEAIVQPPIHIYEVYEKEVEVEDPTDIHKLEIKQVLPRSPPPPVVPYDWTWLILLALLLLILLIIFLCLCCCRVPGKLKGPILKAEVRGPVSFA